MATWTAPLGTDEGTTHFLASVCDEINRQHPTCTYLASVTLEYVRTLREARVYITLGSRELVLHIPAQVWFNAPDTRDLLIYLTSLTEWGRFWSEIDPLGIDPDAMGAGQFAREARAIASRIVQATYADPIPPPHPNPFPRRLIRETP